MPSAGLVTRSGHIPYSPRILVNIDPSGQKGYNDSIP